MILLRGEFSEISEYIDNTERKILEIYRYIRDTTEENELDGKMDDINESLSGIQYNRLKKIKEFVIKKKNVCHYDHVGDDYYFSAIESVSIERKIKIFIASNSYFDGIVDLYFNLFKREIEIIFSLNEVLEEITYKFSRTFYNENSRKSPKEIISCKAEVYFLKEGLTIKIRTERSNRDSYIYFFTM